MAHYCIEILVATSTQDITPNNIGRAKRKKLTAGEAWGAPPRVAPRSAIPARPGGPHWGSGAVVCDEGWSALGRSRAAVVPARLLLLLLGFSVLNLSTEVGCIYGVWLELYV